MFRSRSFKQYIKSRFLFRRFIHTFPGMYKGELDGDEKCFECAFGKYTASQSNTECVNCPTGYYGLLREEGAITDAVTVANELSFAVALNDDSLGTGIQKCNGK